LTNNMTTDKGNTLGAFGEFLLCQGQQQVDGLGYSALPINLVEAGFAQLQKIPGGSVPTATSAILASCNNPTFSSDGTNNLANNPPIPPRLRPAGPAEVPRSRPCWGREPPHDVARGAQPRAGGWGRPSGGRCGARERDRHACRVGSVPGRRHRHWSSGHP